MLVWINGAFGAGKTSLAEALHKRLPEAVAFDPEHVGLLVRRSSPGPVADFQDIPQWRTLTAEFAVTLCRESRRPVIVAMTLVEAGYRDEIFGLIDTAGIDLLHVFLDVPAQELHRRIDAKVMDPDDPAHDARVRALRVGNVDRCVAALPGLAADTLVLPGDRMTPDQLADRVLAAITARGGG